MHNDWLPVRNAILFLIEYQIHTVEYQQRIDSMLEYIAFENDLYPFLCFVETQVLEILLEIYTLIIIFFIISLPANNFLKQHHIGVEA
jgi:hypothetical protein